MLLVLEYNVQFQLALALNMYKNSLCMLKSFTSKPWQPHLYSSILKISDSTWQKLERERSHDGNQQSRWQQLQELLLLSTY